LSEAGLRLLVPGALLLLILPLLSPLVDEESGSDIATGDPSVGFLSSPTADAGLRFQHLMRNKGEIDRCEAMST